MNQIQKLLKNPFERARLIILSIIVLEGLAFYLFPILFGHLFGGGNNPSNIVKNLPIVIIQFLNAALAYYFSYITMNNYDITDYHRKIWRFVMFSMFCLAIGYLISIIYVLGSYYARPPSLMDWFGLMWVLPLLLIAVSREYFLVKTASPPNKVMKIGLWIAVALYAFVLFMVSPLLSPGSFTFSERLLSIWNIGFAFACIIISIALLSEIYKGLLSRSWKIIIVAVLFFSFSYALFQFVYANNLHIFYPWLDVVLKSLSQVGPLLIILASYVELKITS